MRLGYNARLGLGLILVSLLTITFCWQTSVYIEKHTGSLAVYLNDVHSAVLAEDWPMAEQSLQQGINDWQQSRPVLLGLLNHQDVINIDLALHSLDAFLQKQRTDEIVNQLSILDYYLKLAVESDKVNLSNLF